MSSQVIAAGLLSEGPVALGSAEGSFTNRSSLCNCIKASCMLPGIAGVTPAWHLGSTAPLLQARAAAAGGTAGEAERGGESDDEARRLASGHEPMVCVCPERERERERERGRGREGGRGRGRERLGGVGGMGRRVGA